MLLLLLLFTDFGEYSPQYAGRYSLYLKSFIKRIHILGTYSNTQCWNFVFQKLKTNAYWRPYNFLDFHRQGMITSRNLPYQTNTIQIYLVTVIVSLISKTDFTGILIPKIHGLSTRKSIGVRIGNNMRLLDGEMRQPI